MGIRKRRSDEGGDRERDRLYVGGTPIHTREEHLAAERRVAPWFFAFFYAVTTYTLVQPLLADSPLRVARAFGPLAAALAVAFVVVRNGRWWPVFAVLFIGGWGLYAVVSFLLLLWSSSA